jgi:hypothetical protein
MRSIKSYGAFVLVLCAIALGSAPLIAAQEQTSSTRTTTRDDDVNLDTQLYLILATNREVDEGKMPPALDPIMKRLRETLSFKHYSLAGTFLNRVKNNGRLDVSWVAGGSPFMLPNVSTATIATLTPTFNNFGALVRLVTDASGNDIVRMNELRFGAQVPVMTGLASTSSGSFPSAGTPSVVYQTVGLRTDISMREGSTVIAGTLNLGPQGDAIVVVVSARRAN